MLTDYAPHPADFGCLHRKALILPRNMWLRISAFFLGYCCPVEKDISSGGEYCGTLALPGGAISRA